VADAPRVQVKKEEGGIQLLLYSLPDLQKHKTERNEQRLDVGKKGRRGLF